MRAFFALWLWVFFSAPALAIVTFDEGNIVVRSGQKDRLIRVQIAKTALQHQHGLMFRQELKPFEGMLFDFSEPQFIHMWMKNTPLSLDMIFFDEQKNVVYVATDTTPYSLANISSPIPVRYVLEVVAGTAKAWGIQSGDSFAYEKQ